MSRLHRARRLARYAAVFGLGLPAMTLTGPLTFAAGAAAGTLVANIGNVPAGATPTLTPNDGRLAIAGSAGAWKVVVGLTAASAGTIALSVVATGANSASALVTVAAANLPATVNLVFYGDSYIDYQGNEPGGTDANRISAYTTALLAAQFPSVAFTRVNLGFPGQTAVQLDDNFAARAGAAYDPTKTVNYLILEPPGINDFALAGYDDKATVRRIRSIVRKWMALNPNNRVIIGQIFSRNDGSPLTASTLPANILIDKLWKGDFGAVGFAPIASLPEFATAAAANDTTYYRPDKLHLNSNGNQTASQKGYAPAIASTIAGTLGNAVIPTLSPLDISPNMVLSNGNRTFNVANGAFGGIGVKSDCGTVADKSYFEVQIDTAQYLQVGICTRAHEGNIGGGNSYNGSAYAVWDAGGNTTVAGAAGPALGALANSDIVQGCIHKTSKRLFLRKNGVGNWNGSATADPATGVGGIDISGIGDGPYYFYGVSYAAPGQATTRLTAAQQTLAMPAGHVAIGG